ncbi:MAG: beta-glucuronidase, partial [Anaerophaga sp.]|nr:beta-glucuronidase [Anaerophaga sp.]
MKKLFFTFVAFCLVVSAYANENLHPLITNVPNRTAKSLNGQWDYIIDRYEVGYYDYRL